MAATIITVAKIEASGTNIKIKVNDGHSVPDCIVMDTIQSFYTWERDNGHIFIWTNDLGYEMSMIIPQIAIAWIVSSVPIGIDKDRFNIQSPCSVSIEPEV